MFKLQTKGLSFFKNKKGNVAPFFGLMAIPMMAITGGSIDIGQAINAQRQLQNAIDTAAVAVCTAGDGEQTPEQIIRAYLGSELENTKMSMEEPLDGTQAPPELKVEEVRLENAQFNAADGSISPKVTSKAPTTLLKLLQIDEIDIEAETSVKCGAKRLELSLVLDVTGSMDSWAGGRKKIDSMKDAGLDVLDIFDRNLDAGVTRIALVPFSEAVNVGEYADKVRGTIVDGTSQNPGKTKVKFRKNGDWKRYRITQCVSERVGGHAYKDTLPNCSGNNCTHPVGHVYTSNGSCRPGNKFIPLTSDKAKLRQEIQSYQPGGYTAGHIGATWGWYALLENWGQYWPESAPEASNPEELIKATIIMTDGEFNTQYLTGVQDRHRPGSAPNGSSNYQFEKVCEAMKQTDANGDAIVVYTIGFGLNPNSQTAERLKECASDDSKWFFPYNGEELRAAFVSIGKQLSGGQAGKALVQQ